MKFQLFLLVALLSSFCYGKASVSLSPAWHYGDLSSEFKAGVSVYEELFDGIAYDGWAGAGIYTKNGTVWGATTQRLQIRIDDNLIIAPGAIFRSGHSDLCGVTDLLSNSELNVTLSYRLWD